MSIRKSIDKLKSVINFDFTSETMNIISENGYYVVGLVRLQLQEGKDKNDENVTIFGRDFYSDATIFDKERHGVGLGKITEWITNYNTGKFYFSMKTVVEKTTFYIDSDVYYFEDILKRSGKKILELNKKHIEQLKQEVIIPELKKRIKELTHGI